MNKIVCDVCGTSYPETTVQCPICGTAKTDTAKTATGADTGYAYVKGGRFSHANVRKRNAGKKELPRVVAPAKPKKEAPVKPKKETAAPKTEKQENGVKPIPEAPVPQKERPVKQKPAKKGGKAPNILLALIALLLVVAIIAVIAYIVKGYLDERNENADPVGSTSSQTSEPADIRVPCTGLKLALSQKTFTSADDKFYLSVTVSPKDTCTDAVTYESSDPRIATVDDKGIVRPVANGQCIIYVHCGDYTVECYITCENLAVEPTDPTDPTGPTEPTDPVVELVLSKTEIELNGYGDSAIIYNGEIDRAEITWTSSDEEVATVENGKVIAVGNGNATITAEYMGQVATCVVHCANVVVTSYELRTPYGLATDFTLKVGETIKLYLVDKETGVRIQPENLTFTVSKDGIISIDENGKVTALAKGRVTVTVTYGDVSLTAVVRVSK